MGQGIVYARDGYYATVQQAEGEPDPPVVVPVKVSGSKVSFRIAQHLPDQNGHPVPDIISDFDATVTRSGLTGTVKSAPFTLRRRSSYWQ